LLGKMDKPSAIEGGWRAALVVGILAFLLHMDTFGHNFTYDDQRGVLTNPDVSLHTPWANLLTDDFWG